MTYCGIECCKDCSRTTECALGINGLEVKDLCKYIAGVLVAGAEKRMRKIQKLLFTIVLILFSLVLIMYISLCMFVKSKESIIEENFLLENTNVYLAEEQLEIASFIFTKDKNPKFKKYPLIIDFFSFKNQIARFVSSDFVDNSLSSLDHSFQIFATSRRLVRKTNYKICYNYIFSKMYFGNDVYGLKEACLHYFGKIIMNWILKNLYVYV